MPTDFSKELKELYRKKVLKVCNYLKTDDLKKSKYLYRDSINETDMNNIETPLDLVVCLERCGILGFDKVDKFAEILVNIGKAGLVPILEPVYSTPVEVLTRKTKRFTRGRLFVFTINNVESVKKVEIRYSNNSLLKNDQWKELYICLDDRKMHEINDDFCFYLKKQTRLYLKIENILNKKEIDFRIIFIEKNKKEHEVFSNNEDFSGLWYYELKHNELNIMVPEPILENFSENWKASDSFDSDWRFKRGECCPNFYNNKSLVSLAEDYMDRQFKNNAVICNGDVFQETDMSNVFKKFNDNLGKCNNICAIFTNYPLNYHAELLHLPCDINLKLVEDKNRLIIFSSKNNVIIFVRIAPLKKFKKECENLLLDISLYCNINMPLIGKERLNLLGILVLPSVAREEANNKIKTQFSIEFIKEHLHNLFFLFKNEIFKEAFFEDWWLRINEHLCKKKSSLEEVCNAALFKKLIGSGLLFLAEHDRFTPLDS